MKKPRTNQERLDLAITCLRQVSASMIGRCPEGLTKGQAGVFHTEIQRGLVPIEAVAKNLERLALAREGFPIRDRRSA